MVAAKGCKNALNALQKCRNFTMHIVIIIIKLVTTKRRNYFMSELNYHTRKFFAENLLAIEMKKREIPMKKPEQTIVYVKQIIVIKILQKILKLDLIL